MPLNQTIYANRLVRSRLKMLIVYPMYKEDLALDKEQDWYATKSKPSDDLYWLFFGSKWPPKVHMLKTK